MEEPIELGISPKGINNIEKETTIPEGFIRNSVNLDIDNQGKKKLRSGFTKIYSGSNIHSISSEDVNGKYFIENGTLKKLNKDNTASIIKSGLSSDPRRRMYYVQMGDRIYLSNGYDTGCLISDTYYSWGVPNPAYGPSGTISSGNFDGGVYRIKYVNMKNGEESGASNFGSFTLTDNQKISLTNIPQTSDADYVRIYSTLTNGNNYYWQADVPMGITTWSLSKPQLNKELETDNLYSPPPGHIITAYNSRVYIAYNNQLYWTEALRWGLCHYNNYIDFPNRITTLIAVNDGLYIVSDKTYFLKGDDPKDFKLNDIYPYGSIEGTQYLSYSNKHKIEENFGYYSGPIAVWMSEKGLVFGKNNGEIIPVTEKNYALDQYNSGATGFLEHEGIKRLITTLTQKGSSSGLKVTDKVVATVRQNGVS